MPASESTRAVCTPTSGIKEIIGKGVRAMAAAVEAARLIAARATLPRKAGRPRPKGGSRSRRRGGGGRGPGVLAQRKHPPVPSLGAAGRPRLRADRGAVLFLEDQAV